MPAARCWLNKMGELLGKPNKKEKKDIMHNAEDCGGADAFMANRWRYSALGSGMSREDGDDLVEAFDDEEGEIEGRYHPNRFDRRQVNRALSQLAADPTQGDAHEMHDSAVD